jgi:signal transduction histidine kinase
MAAHVGRIVTVLAREPEGPFLQQLGVQTPVFVGAVGSAIGGGLAFLAIRLELLQNEAVAAATRAARAEAERDATEREHRETKLAHDETKRLLTERTDLIDLLAHEIRQPLNNASAALEAALEASKPDPAGASARALVRASNVLARVISTLNNTLAAATRLAEDAQAITRQPTDLRDIIELARLSFDESRIERIAVRVDALTTDAALDASLMQLAIRNLLDNALKFSPPGTRVQLVLDELESGDWRVRVTNVGHLERLSRDVDVFEKRVRGVTGRSVEGAGLGLFIVRRVAELHGGAASMEEADGQVTVGFSFAGV